MIYKETVTKRPCAHPKRDYKSYVEMGKYIIANSNWSASYINGLLDTIKTCDGAIEHKVEHFDGHTFIYTKTPANGAKGVLTRIFRETARKHNDEEYFERIAGEPLEPPLHDKFYISCKTEKIVEKENDFFSLDVTFLLPKYAGDMESEIKDNIIELYETAIDKAYKKLQRGKHRDIPRTFIEPKRAIWRKNFSELIITIGLRQDILDLKERMTQETEGAGKWE